MRNLGGAKIQMKLRIYVSVMRSEVYRAGLGQRKEGRAPKLAPSCATTGVGPQWWRSTAALRTEGVVFDARLQS